jgi:hypothetical protein
MSGSCQKRNQHLGGQHAQTYHMPKQTHTRTYTCTCLSKRCHDSQFPVTNTIRGRTQPGIPWHWTICRIDPVEAVEERLRNTPIVNKSKGVSSRAVSKFCTCRHCELFFVADKKAVNELVACHRKCWILRNMAWTIRMNK